MHNKKFIGILTMYNTLRVVELLKPLKACLQQQQRMVIEFTTILILGWVDIFSRNLSKCFWGSALLSSYIPNHYM